MKTISQQFWNAGQSWNFTRIVKTLGPTLKVDIRRNSYNEQCHVRGYALDRQALGWNLLVDRPISTAKCKDVSYVRANENVKPFEQDADSIIEELLAICE